MTWLDALGWAGSAILILSLALSNVLRFRVLNLAASVVLTVFNLLLGIWPMVAMNGVIAVINVWFLIGLLRSREDDHVYEVVRVGAEEPYLAHLLRVHAADVEKFNPGFDWTAVATRGDQRWGFLVLRGDETVGMVLLSCSEPDRCDEVRVELDYVTPRFRDLSVGRFVYREDGPLGSLGMKRLVASRRMSDRGDYFSRVGFHPEDGELVRDVRG